MSDRRRRGLGGGAAALVLASSLAACGGDDGGPPTLTWYINPDSGGQAEIASRCTDAAEGAYEISTEVLPRDAAGPARAADPPARGRGLLDRHHEPRPAVHPRVRPGRLPRRRPRRPRRPGHRGRRGERHRGLDVERRDRRRPVLGQHPDPLVPDVGGRGRRARHDPAGHLGPDHPGRPGPGRADRRPGHPRGVAHRVAQRPDRVRRRAHHRGERRRPRGHPAGPGQRRRPARRRGHARGRRLRSGERGLLHRERGRLGHRLRERRRGGFQVNYPFV